MSSRIYARDRKQNKYFKVLILLVLLVFNLVDIAGATVYRWTPSSSIAISTDITTDWGSCGTNPTTNRITLLTDSPNSGCSSDNITSGIPDPVGETYPIVEMFFNTGYSQDTDVTGNWYFGRINNAGVTPTTYTFYLIYAFPNGTKITLPGTASLTLSGSSDLNYNISLGAINGIVPKDAKPGLKITKSVQWNRYLWFGDSAGKGGVASGYFSVTETVPGALTYNISGYVTNGSSGLPLEGVTVRTNTSLTTTTNSEGYYLFSGLANGSYLIDASFSGYVDNSTGATISGANMANINISLLPEPEYILSGYVTEQLTNVALDDVAIMTDTDLLTITNASGYYEFVVKNGTYLITASKSGYDDGFLEAIVNGADEGNSNITLTSILPTVGKILVSTNRYVVLDDPIDNSKTAQTTANFSLPSYTGWTTSNNQWSGTQTQIKGYALLIDAKGTPVPYSNLTFTLSNWNGASSETSPVITTDANGLANYTFDMNARNYYGNWNITANASGKTASSGFIYNWWGCNAGGCYNHQSDTTGSPNSGRQNSPYTLGRESITANSNHGTARNDNNCAGCHRSYGGTGGGNQFTGQPTKTSDVHTTNTCATCHNTSTVHTTDVKIRSCTDCHTRTDLAKKSTMNGSSPQRSNYSSASAAGHNPNSTILCIICHGPMHNISKPDNTQRSIRNSDTESSHCSVCHTTYSKHNASNISGGLNCTLCHSDDIHSTQILGQDGSYVTYNKVNPNATSGNCTSCHQNETYFNTLKTQTKAGTYSGRNPTVIRDPQLHSDAFDAGIRYGNYWWMQNQDASCRYCHGSSMHEPVGLGKPNLFKGNNVINSTIGNTTWCASCHYPDYPEYSNMTVAFLADGKSVPPSIIKGSNYFIKGRDHSIDLAFNDSYCYKCHNGSEPYTKISPFMHEVYIGGGGPDCLGCHEIGSAGSVLHVNNSVMKLSIHANLNNQSVNLYGVPADNKKCWGCHQTDGTQPGNTSMGDRFSSPYTCYDCHKNDDKPYPNVEDAGRVINHIDEDSIITRIYTHNATCTTCHNNSVNLDDAKITDARIVLEKESVSHYGSISSLVESIGDSSPDGCVYCHYNATNSAKWGKAHDPRSNPVQPHTATKNSQCYICHIQGTLPADFHSESMYYAGNGKIVLSANRYVILDDPNSGKAETTAGFSTPRNNWNTNYWSGKNTRINATALFIDRYGAPQSGSIITFTIYWPNGTALATITDTANSYGLANFSYDLNNRNYYGNWKIRASSGSIGANITFIYNWWGCSVCHGSENPGSGTPSITNSPYLSGRDRITNEDWDHRDSNVNCTYCHSSYDGVAGGATFTTRTNKPSDVHRNISCNNMNCHGDFTQHNTNQRINSCYNSSCHSRNDISRKGTLNGINLDIALSIYSNNNVQSFNSTFHTPNSTVPCIICHGPMHSITKVDPSQRFIRNNDTEYNTCISCHQDYVRHNNTVNCPVCHSDDVHAIKVFAQNATYVTMNHNDPNPKRGNCSNCHQNSSFFGTLLSQPKAGNYTGRYSPIMRSPVNHSEDSNAGSIWLDEGYWVKNDQISWCDYCHNNEMHTTSTLGKVKLFRGDNIVNSTIGNTSWCASCHWQGYSNDSTKYVDMVDTFTGYLLPIPPEITGHTLYAPTERPGYYNHTLSGYSDQDCVPCHSIAIGDGARITEFTHNVRKGQSGGKNCTSCHNIGGSAGHDVDIANMNSSAHAGLNNRSQYTGGNNTNRKCWACHGTLNANGFANETDQPAADHNQTFYKKPRTCPDCHNNLQPNLNFSAPQVVEHREGAPVVPTGGTMCSLCHNNSLTLINETDGFGVKSPRNATASHYLNEANANLMTSSNHSNDCRWCHILNNGSANWGTPFDPRNSTKYQHDTDNVALNESCYSCHGELISSVKLHDPGITKGGAGGQNCVSCHEGTTGNKVNLANMNRSDSIHMNLNSLGTSNGRPENKMCYACHANDSYISAGIINNSSLPIIGHPSGYKVPKNCTQCHINTNGAANFSALQVTEHRSGADEIQTPDYSDLNNSCISCHNLNEMLRPFSDNKVTNLSSVSHYGKERTDYPANGSNNYCNKCHSNVSAVFPFTDPANKTISNHSANYASPACADCHASGRIHDSVLTKSVLSLPNSTYCTGCHGPGGSASLKNKDKHNGTVDCTKCHLDSSRSIHPVRYLKEDGSSWSVSKANSVNCTNCHQAVQPGFPDAPIISGAMQHSSNISNGTIWGTFWASGKDSCYYCHNDTKHNLTALGKPGTFKGENKVGEADMTRSTWCISCHLNGTSNYDIMKAVMIPIPPAIISGDPNYPGEFAIDHSPFTMNNDQDCTGCHAGDITNISTFMHNLSEGKGCASCHSQPPAGTTRNNMTGAHDLHKAAGYGDVPETGCNYCHNSGGLNELRHPQKDGAADVVTNISAFIAVYNQTLASGNDDTCSGVSCHSAGLSINARTGTSIWNSSTAGKCDVCHSNEISGLPQTGNHTKHYTVANYSCATCHGTNADTGAQIGHKKNGQIDINFTNVSAGGSIVSGTCTVYCHSPNANDSKPKPVWNSSNVTCGGCHSSPPVNFMTRHGMPHPANTNCDACHGAGAINGKNSGHIDGNITITSLSCITCHDVGGNTSTKVDSASFGMHSNVNKTDGGLTDEDCEVCHFFTDGMLENYEVLPGVNVHLCNDCHLNQTIPSTRISEHYPGANISVTTMDCENCHSNSLNTPNPLSTVNTTIGNVTHYGTTTNLVKPTAGTYNTACNICHNSATNKILYGVENKQVTMSHTSAGTCDGCHVNSSSSADTLHNVSLEMPETNNCHNCHTNYADKYGTANMTGTTMDSKSGCGGTYCHGAVGSTFDSTVHNVDTSYGGTPGSVDIVYLNNLVSLTVTKGTIVQLTSRVKDALGAASRVGGAEYYIDVDPGQGKGIPMNPADGFYDAVNGNWEDVIATIDTSSLSGDSYVIYVRGVDIGKQWSTPMSATLIVQSLGYINISSNVPKSIVYINGESNTTDSNGNYSWIINYGTYNITVRKDPEYYANTTNGIVVTANNITNHNVTLALKPNGTILGAVRSG